MGFEYLTNVPLDQAKKEYLWKLQSNGFRAQLETVPVQESFGRITSRAVYARINAPHYAASAMDGAGIFWAYHVQGGLRQDQRAALRGQRHGRRGSARKGQLRRH